MKARGPLSRARPWTISLFRAGAIAYKRWYESAQRDDLADFTTPPDQYDVLDVRQLLAPDVRSGGDGLGEIMDACHVVDRMRDRYVPKVKVLPNWPAIKTVWDSEWLRRHDRGAWELQNLRREIAEAREIADEALATARRAGGSAAAEG